jgi:hypothetical protein
VGAWDEETLLLLRMMMRWCENGEGNQEDPLLDYLMEWNNEDVVMKVVGSSVGGGGKIIMMMMMIFRKYKVKGSIERKAETKVKQTPDEMLLGTTLEWLRL